MGMSRSLEKVAAALILLSSAAVAHAQDSKDYWNFPDFSAIQLIGAERQPIPMKVYWSAPELRIDTSPALADLFLPATGKVYRLTTYPDKSRQCVVMRFDQAKMLPSPLRMLLGTKIKRTSAGTENVEGHSCKVERVSVTTVDGSIVESTIWEAEDLKGVPVKIESTLDQQTFTAVYRDIALAPLDKSLFTPPDKCIPYEKMGQVVEDKTIK
jgi:hypothetical protein